MNRITEWTIAGGVPGFNKLKQNVALKRRKPRIPGLSCFCDMGFLADEGGVLDRLPCAIAVHDALARCIEGLAVHSGSGTDPEPPPHPNPLPEGEGTDRVVLSSYIDLIVRVELRF